MKNVRSIIALRYTILRRRMSFASVSVLAEVRLRAMYYRLVAIRRNFLRAMSVLTLYFCGYLVRELTEVRRTMNSLDRFINDLTFRHRVTNAPSLRRRNRIRLKPDLLLIIAPLRFRRELAIIIISNVGLRIVITARRIVLLKVRRLVRYKYDLLVLFLRRVDLTRVDLYRFLNGARAHLLVILILLKERNVRTSDLFRIYLRDDPGYLEDAI